MHQPPWPLVVWQAGEHWTDERRLQVKTYGAERAQERADLKAAYEAGASIRTLAAAHGHSYGYVHDALTEAGAQLRGRGGPNNLNPVPIPPEKAHRGGAKRADPNGS